MDTKTFTPPPAKTAYVLQIHQVSHLLGIPSGSIRNWQDRYGFLSHASHRGNYRRTYSLLDTCQIDSVSRLTQVGGKPKVLCALSRKELMKLLRERASAPMREARERLQGATKFNNLEQFEKELATLLLSAESCEFVIEPLLEQIGELWHEQKMDVQAEHVFSGLIRSWIHKNTQAVATNERALEIVVGGLSEDLHEGAALMINAVLRLHRIQTRYVGMNTPIAEFEKLDRETRKRIFILSASACRPVPSSELEQLSQFKSMVVVGGGGIDSIVSHPLSGKIPLIDHFSASRFGEIFAQAIKNGYLIG